MCLDSGQEMRSKDLMMRMSRPPSESGEIFFQAGKATFSSCKSGLNILAFKSIIEQY